MHGVAWINMALTNFLYVFMRIVKVIMILDASSEAEGDKILQGFILHFYPVQSNEARSVWI